MLGIVSRKPVPREWLERFRRLAHTGMLPRGKKGHKDGWGVGFFRGGRGELTKEPEDAFTSPLLADLARKPLQARLIAHIRHASHGGVSYENTHPFLLENMLFCHNGTLYMDSEKKTDSEIFFESLLKAAKGHDLKEAVMRTAETARAKFRYSSLSFLLLTPLMLLAYRDYRTYKNYYTLFFAKRKDMIVVCSERLDKEKWTLLENKEIFCVYNDLGYERCFYGQGR